MKKKFRIYQFIYVWFLGWKLVGAVKAVWSEPLAGKYPMTFTNIIITCLNTLIHFLNQGFLTVEGVIMLMLFLLLFYMARQERLKAEKELLSIGK
jgi:hypothetical protein